MNHIHVSALLTRLAHSMPAGTAGSWQAWLLEVAAAADRLLSDCAPRQLSNMLWAWARLGWHPGPLWLADWVDAMLRVLPSASCRDVSNALWALAALQGAPQPHGQHPGHEAQALDPVLARELQAALARTLAAGDSGGGANAQDVANALWALAHLQLSPAPELLQLLLLAVQRHQDVMKPQVRAWAQGGVEGQAIGRPDRQGTCSGGSGGGRVC
jgi:hypothetical protein